MGTRRLFCLLDKRPRLGKPCAVTSDRSHLDGPASLCPSYGLVVAEFKVVRPTSPDRVIPAGIAGIQGQGWQVAGTAEARSRRRRSCPVTPRKTPAPVRCHRFAVPGRLDSGVPPGM